jgi:hypothetical protein
MLESFLARLKEVGQECRAEGVGVCIVTADGLLASEGSISAEAALLLKTVDPRPVRP